MDDVSGLLVTGRLSPLCGCRDVHKRQCSTGFCHEAATFTRIFGMRMFVCTPIVSHGDNRGRDEPPLMCCC
jgi:hypothetical protein